MVPKKVFISTVDEKLKVVVHGKHPLEKVTFDVSSTIPKFQDMIEEIGQTTIENDVEDAEGFADILRRLFKEED